MCCDRIQCYSKLCFVLVLHRILTFIEAFSTFSMSSSWLLKTEDCFIGYNQCITFCFFLVLFLPTRGSVLLFLKVDVTIFAPLTCLHVIFCINRLRICVRASEWVLQTCICICSYSCVDVCFFSSLTPSTPEWFICLPFLLGIKREQRA